MKPLGQTCILFPKFFYLCGNKEKKSVILDVYFGNIVYNGLSLKAPSFLRVCKTFDDADRSLPTLIIGLMEAKKRISSFNILKKAYPEQNLWWTFKKTERRGEFIDDMECFKSVVLDNSTKDISYEYVDVINLNYDLTKKLLQIVDGQWNKYVYLEANRHLFFFSPPHKIVFGLSLNICRFCNMKSSKVTRRIFQNEKNIVIDDFDCIPKEVKEIIGCNLYKYTILFRYFYEGMIHQFAPTT